MGRPQQLVAVFVMQAGRGLQPTANRSFFTFSMRRSTANSTMRARSPEGRRWRSRSWAWRSLSRRLRLAVNCTCEGVLGERRDRALHPPGRRRSRCECKLRPCRRRAGRQLAHAGRNWRLGCEPRDQLLDVALRLARRASEDLAMVLSGEMTNEETQAGQVHLAGP